MPEAVDKSTLAECKGARVSSEPRPLSVQIPATFDEVPKAILQALCPHTQTHAHKGIWSPWYVEECLLCGLELRVL